MRIYAITTVKFLELNITPATPAKPVAKRFGAVFAVMLSLIMQAKN
jgi:hypothetical protein